MFSVVNQEDYPIAKRALSILGILLSILVATVVQPQTTAGTDTEGNVRMKLKERVLVSRGNETSAAYENVYYLSATDPTMIRVRIAEIGSDIYDVCRISYSADGGMTWGEDQPYQVSFATPAGMVRTGHGTPVPDPTTGRLVVLGTTSVLPNDEMLEALTYSFPTYRVSEDGGITWLFDNRIVHHGDAYSAGHPLPSVWTGKNAVHYSNVPFFDREGRFIVPVQITRLNPDGTIFCPPGALSFHEMLILIGTWQDDGQMRWEASEKISLQPDVSTRGVCEGAVAEMPDGRFLMVIRGSNAGNASLPGHKWYATSADGCRTWSEIRPWSYTDGTLFHSPSSYSTILPHSNGRYYWVGNICEDNPNGNGPDYPLFIGEIDPDTFLLRRESLCDIDTFLDTDPAPVHLRNFSLYEERSTGDIVLRMTRLWVDDARHLRGNAYLYRIEP